MNKDDKEEFPPLLSLGFHPMDVRAVRRLCVDRFQHSVTRNRIMGNLERLINSINISVGPSVLWIDGSFLTEKLNPDDADLVLVVSRANFQAMSVTQRQFFDWFRNARLYDSHRIDNYAVVLDEGAEQGIWFYSYWLRQFGFSRDDEAKGIASVSVPFLVKP